MTGKEHGNGRLWPLQARPYITLHQEVANLSLRHLIQRSLLSKMMEGLKAHALLSLTPRPGRAERLGNRAINVYGTRIVVPGSCACAMTVTPSPLLP